MVGAAARQYAYLLLCIGYMQYADALFFTCTVIGLKVIGSLAGIGLKEIGSVAGIFARGGGP